MANPRLSMICQFSRHRVWTHTNPDRICAGFFVQLFLCLFACVGEERSLLGTMKILL